MSTSPVRISEVQANYQDTELSTAQTVAEMGAHVRASLNDPELQRVAATLSPAYTMRDRAGAVWAWVKAHVRFVTDEVLLLDLLGRRDELELLISPGVLLRARVPAGDCDDFTMLCCALLAALGVPPLVKTYKVDRSDPARWSHVCAAAILEDGSIFPVDASHGAYAGWEVPAREVFQSQLWDMNGNRVGGSGMGRTRGLSGYVAAPNWTGSEMTTYQGPYAGPYPGGDIQRAYYPRAAGLRGIAAGKYRGIGDLSDLVDPTGTGTGSIDTSDGSTITETSMSTDIQDFFSGIFNSTNGVSSSGSVGSGSGSSFSNFLSQLTGSAASVAAAALATPGAVQRADGSILLPNGTIVPAASSGISSSTLLIISAVLLGVVLLSKKK
jgi:hypothetical protein